MRNPRRQDPHLRVTNPLTLRINQSNKKGKSFNKDKAQLELFGHSGSIQCVQFLSPQYIIVS